MSELLVGNNVAVKEGSLDTSNLQVIMIEVKFDFKMILLYSTVLDILTN